MANLSDIIEEFIKSSFDGVPEGVISIQRNDMANQFNCAPSQINYVLTTRFSMERGYLIESRRGGGGYIRIKKIKIREDVFFKEIIDFIGDSISGGDARAVIKRIFEEGFVTEREAVILMAAVNKYSLPLCPPDRGILRASIMKAMISSIVDHHTRKGGESDDVR